MLQTKFRLLKEAYFLFNVTLLPDICLQTVGIEVASKPQYFGLLKKQRADFKMSPFEALIIYFLIYLRSETGLFVCVLYKYF